MKSIGIDLAALGKNPTGIAILEGLEVGTGILHSDSEIIKDIYEEDPDIVAIDAPLSFPRGMKGFRSCERKLIKLGFRFFPPVFKHMKLLTQRGMKLASILRGSFEVIEVHPKTSMKILGIDDIEDLNTLKIMPKSKKASRHEFDAIIASYTGFLHLKKRTEVIKNEGSIVIPVSTQI